MLPAQGAPVRTRTASDLLAFYGVRMTPETEGLLTALREARRLLLITTRDATDAQLAERSTVSQLTLGGILNHLTRGERVWTHILTCLLYTSPSPRD